MSMIAASQTSSRTSSIDLSRRERAKLDPGVVLSICQNFIFADHTQDRIAEAIFNSCGYTRSITRCESAGDNSTRCCLRVDAAMPGWFDRGDTLASWA
jgi:hypothetical protein